MVIFWAALSYPFFRFIFSIPRVQNIWISKRRTDTLFIDNLYWGIFCLFVVYPRIAECMLPLPSNVIFCPCGGWWNEDKKCLTRRLFKQGEEINVCHGGFIDEFSSWKHSHFHGVRDPSSLHFQTLPLLNVSFVGWWLARGQVSTAP